MPANSWEIHEIEGADRWRATLFGRARPKKDESPQFGVQPRAEDSFNRGQSEGRTEPLGLSYPDLTIGGEWKIGFFLTGDARVTFKPTAPSRTNKTPQEVCDFFEEFAARQKTVQVTMSSGVVRICRWESFLWEFTRGGDRKWKIAWKVLGRGQAKPFELASPLTARTSLANLQRAALGLDKLLADYPGRMNPGFLESIHETAAKGREVLARTRQLLGAAGDLARAPASVWNDLTTLCEAGRETMVAIRDQFDATALEYQVLYARTEDLAKAHGWRASVKEQVNGNLDALFALLEYLDGKRATAKKYIPCQPGDSLVRIAIAQYGSGAGSSWRRLADANGITGQTVPTGVTRLLIPE